MFLLFDLGLQCRHSLITIDLDFKYTFVAKNGAYHGVLLHHEWSSNIGYHLPLFATPKHTSAATVVRAGGTSGSGSSD